MAGGRQGLLHVATIGKPNGVRGAVSLRVFLEDPADIGRYGPLATKGGRAVSLRVLRVSEAQAIAAIDGVADRDAAEALKGTELYLERGLLPEAGEDEFYHADLIGLAVREMAGEMAGGEIGRVVAVQDFGAGDLLEVALAAGGSAYVPFTRAFVPRVEPAEGWLAVDAPEGLLEAPAKRPSRVRRSKD